MAYDALELLRAAEPAEELLLAAIKEPDCPEIVAHIYCYLEEARTELIRALEAFNCEAGWVETWLRETLAAEGAPRAFERAYYELALARRNLIDEMRPTITRTRPLWPADTTEDDLPLWHPGYFDGERRRRGSGRPMR